MKKSVQEDLRKFVREMDDVVNAISAKVEMLNDIEIMFGQLRESMDTATFNGKEQFYHREHHRKIRILSELMHHVMEGLTEAQERAEAIHLAIFDKVVMGGQKGEESIGA